jgi:peptidoglycan/xylan/chitin deacetylase (PgdA/CDA1 family)
MNGVVTGALRASWKLPFIGSVTSRRPIVLLYHGTPPRRSGVSMPADAFEQHIQFLTRHFECVPIGGRRKRRAFDRIQVAVTFDDGFRNNATIAAPILRKYRVPATFFLCSRHAEPNGYLWFAYLEALEENFRGNGFSFRGQFMDMSPGQRPETMARLREWLLELTPHPAAMYSAIESELPQLEDFISSEYLSEHYAGMTVEQIQEVAADPLFTVGVHTADHPFLTKCQPDEAIRQLDTNRRWIERTVATRCDIVAYPSGDYDDDVLTRCHGLGFTGGYALTPRSDTRPELQVPRVGVYSTSLDVLGMKVQWGNVLRALRYPVG